MKKTFACTLFSLSTLALGVLAVGSSEAADPVKIKVGHLVALDMAPLFVAKETECFSQNGLDVETIFFANPGDSNAALAGKAIDFSINPFTLPFFAANSGVPIKVVAAAGGWGVMEVIASESLGLDSMDSLKKYIETHSEKLKIATLQGDTLELILTREFEKTGIKQDDVELVYFNDLLAMVESFRNGKTDILSHIKPYTTEMITSKGATVLTNNAETWSTTAPNTVVSVLDETLQERPEIVEGYMKGLICAADLINSDPETAARILNDGHYFRVDSDVLVNAFSSAPAPISFIPDIDAVQSVVTDLANLGYIKGGTAASDIFDLDIINELEEAL